MKKSQPFFYKINAVDFFSKIHPFSNKELVKWIRTFSADLVRGKSDDDFTAKIIEEVNMFRKKKSVAGIKGMESRWPKP